MKKIFPITAFMTLLILLFGTILHVPQPFSEKENRGLQTTVTIKERDLVSGRAMEMAEAYLSDQLLFRDAFVATLMRVEVALGKVLSEDVYLGAEGRLMQRFIAPAEETRRKLVQTLASFKAHYPNEPMALMIAPTSCSIYPQLLPVDAYGSQESLFFEQIREELPDYDHLWLLPLMQAKENDRYYFKTDHHWTPAGAFIAASAYVNHRGYTPLTLSYFEEKVSSKPFYGSLIARSGFYHVPGESFSYYEPPFVKRLVVTGTDGESRALFDETQLEKRDQYAVFLGGNDAKVTIENPDVQKGHLVIIKDSYANAVIPFLTPYYHKVTVIDPRYCNGGILQYMPEQFDEILVLMNVISFGEGQWVKNLTM